VIGAVRIARHAVERARNDGRHRLLTLVSNEEHGMKKALMITAMVLATSTGGAVAGTSQSNAQNGAHPNKHHSNGAATKSSTKSMNRGTSANGGMGTGGVITGSGVSGSSDNPANTSLDRSGRAGTSASPGTVSGPQSR
jgi:hypothetical protein